jgi:pimeloyl-ACP methyl ester carboxylesterase
MNSTASLASDRSGSKVDFGSPSFVLLGTEPIRAAFEYAAMRSMSRSALPPGDGHSVVFFPGLGADQRSTRPLRDFCDSLGYETHDWGRGINRGPQGDVDRWLRELAFDVDDMTAGNRGRMSLIGWSLGGIYAREIAKVLPRRVRNVVTLGTPFAGNGHQTNVGWAYRLLNGRPLKAEPAMLQRLRTAPAAHTTSIYSRSDGVVAWQACINEALPHVANVEVSGSHCGLGWNRQAMAAVAQALARKTHLTRPVAACAAAGRY